jgi:hypothetical protein
MGEFCSIYGSDDKCIGYVLIGMLEENLPRSAWQ